MAASACIVCFTFLYLHLYIYNFIKKRKNHFDPFLGKTTAVDAGEGVRKGVGQLAQGGTFLLDISDDMPSQA